MDVALWVVQGVLALMFLMAGVMKSTQPLAALAEKMDWVNDSTPTTVRFAGAAEVAGALGLIAPMALNTVPWLTPVAAAGLALIMVLAAATVHLPRKEGPAIGMNAMLAGACAFVVYGRWDLMPL